LSWQLIVDAVTAAVTGPTFMDGVRAERRLFDQAVISPSFLFLFIFSFVSFLSS
jgi:hypothetical protein